MKVLIVGSGGREHALGWKIAQSPLLKQLFFAPGNPGTASLGENLALAGHVDVVAFCRKEAIDLVIVGPEQPLVEGLADALNEAGIACFGPNQAAARLEGSKAFSKEVMAAVGVPTAAYRDFVDYDEALAWAKEQKHPLVVKADGLAGGKGVTICQNLEETEAALKATMLDGKFGQSGDKVVLEEFLVGTEASFHVICDGKDVFPLVAAQDHKALYEGNRGPNTGGMGTFAPSPLVTPVMADLISQDICKPILDYMDRVGSPFRGVLFAGLMLTEDGPKVLEFNVRFGDPETQVMMPLLNFDLLPVLHGAAQGRLPENIDADIHSGSAVCVVLAAAGYPDSPQKGMPIVGLDRVEQATVFHAGTKNEGDHCVVSGGRVLGVTAQGKDLAEARRTAYAAVDLIDFTGKQFRKDIGGSHV